jgi:hypothetical protein
MVRVDQEADLVGQVYAPGMPFEVGIGFLLDEDPVGQLRGIDGALVAFVRDQRTRLRTTSSVCSPQRSWTRNALTGIPLSSRWPAT